MRIQINDLFNCFQGLNLIYQKEETKFDGTFDYFMQKQNIPILQKEVQKLQGYSNDERIQLSTEFIDIPLQKVPVDTLPSGLDKGVIMLIDSLIDGDIDGNQYQSQTDYDALVKKEETLEINVDANENNVTNIDDVVSKVEAITGEKLDTSGGAEKLIDRIESLLADKECIVNTNIFNAEGD